MLQEHPLSQARVVNSQILTSLTDILSGLDGRLSELKKLDEILEILRAREAVKQEEMKLGAVERVIKRVRHITLKDRILIDLLEKRSPISADDAAAELNLSRSTISYRMNKLYSMGVLDKEVLGRKILFKISDPVVE